MLAEITTARINPQYENLLKQKLQLAELSEDDLTRALNALTSQEVSREDAMTCNLLLKKIASGSFPFIILISHLSETEKVATVLPDPLQNPIFCKGKKVDYVIAERMNISLSNLSNPLINVHFAVNQLFHMEVVQESSGGYSFMPPYQANPSYKPGSVVLTKGPSMSNKIILGYPISAGIDAIQMGGLRKQLI